MTPFIKKIVKNHPRVLVYYGDTDMACNFMMGQQFADQLGLRRTLKKTPWKFNRQIAGFKTLPGSVVINLLLPTNIPFSKVERNVDCFASIQHYAPAQRLASTIPQISPTIRRHSSNVKTYDAIQFRDKLRRGVSLENIGPHRVCFYPQPTPSHRNPSNANRPVIFSKNPIGSASKNISRKVSSYSKMSSLARVAWVSKSMIIFSTEKAIGFRKWGKLSECESFQEI
ncbi:hypothetical protein CRE_16315 [Caenorhabditis remanei]|uniref:Uncharacterized protein n=1 Tax=Caenorhabditis remanei TaxID=31234 RepID=E3N827_CAERE|nr:hypothetical protein CRE_16315 [Caenorhabditis remanei]